MTYHFFKNCDNFERKKTKKWYKTCFIKKCKLIQFVFYLVISDSHDNCETCLDVLQALENIDDDAERQNIALVKTTDAEFAEDIGITEFPSLGNTVNWLVVFLGYLL